MTASSEPLLAHGAGVLGAQRIQMPLAFRLGSALRFQVLANLGDLRGQRVDPLRRRLELQAELPALSAKALELLIGSRSFVVQTLRFAIQRGHPLFRLRDAVAHRRSRGNRLQNRIAPLLLLALDIHQPRRRGGRVLLPLLQLLLRVGNVGIGRLQRRPVRLQFLLQPRALLFGVADLGLRSGGAGIQLSAALLVGATALGSAIDLQRQRVEFLAVLLRLALDGVAALGAIAVLRFHLLHGFALGAQLLADFGELHVESRRLGIELRELAGQHARATWRASRRAAWRSARPSTPAASANSSAA